MKVAIVMSPEASSRDVDRVVHRVVRDGGRIRHRYPPRVMVAEAASAVSSIASLPGVLAVHDSTVPDPGSLGLDRSAEAGLTAYNVLRSTPAAPDLDTPPEPGPGSCTIAGDDLASLSRRRKAVTAPTDTSQYLTGSAAVGLILVDGPAAARFTPSELENAIAQSHRGAEKICDIAPPGAGISFVWDIHTVELTLGPDRVEHAGWGPEALQALGYGNADQTQYMDAMYDYLQDLRTERWHVKADWAFIAFLTKYAAVHYAYAYIGGPRLVVRYSNDGWGPDRIDHVFAHEVGHIFGAADEYKLEKPCSCTKRYGQLQVKNANCVTCNPHSVPCLMRMNPGDVCEWSAGMLGWRGLPWTHAPLLTGLCMVEQAGPRGAQLWGLDSAGTLWSTYQVAPGGPWSAWSPRGWADQPEPFDSLAAAQQNDGRVQLWGLGRQGSVRSIWQTAPGGGWTGWSTPGWQGQPVPFVQLQAVQQGGRRGAQLWALDAGNRLYGIYQRTPGDDWSSWRGPGWLDQPAGFVHIAAAQQNDGRVQLWALDDAGRVYSVHQTAPGGGWAGWMGPGWSGQPIPFRRLAASQQGGERGAQVWALDAQGKLHSIYQQRPGDDWSSWSGPEWCDQPVDFKEIAAAQQNDGTVRLCALDLANQLWVIAQTGPGSGWGPWTPDPALPEERRRLPNIT